MAPPSVTGVDIFPSLGGTFTTDLHQMSTSYIPVNMRTDAKLSQFNIKEL